MGLSRFFLFTTIIVLLLSVGLWFVSHRGGNRIRASPENNNTVRCAVYGSDRTVRVEHVLAPVLGELDVEVRMAYAALNPADIKLKKMWLPCGATDERPCALGFDGAGVVSKVGSNVTFWRVGDRVMLTQVLVGSACEFVSISQEKLARVTAQVPLRRAAALPVIARTSLDALQLRCPITFHTKRVLIAGGGTSIGVTGIQLAREAQAEVIATCGNASLCKAAGATHIIDYRKESVADGLARLGIDHVDIVYECSYTPDLYWAVRKMQPCYVSAEIGELPQQLWRWLWSKLVDGVSYQLLFGLKSSLESVAKMAEEFKVLPHLHVFPLTNDGVCFLLDTHCSCDCVSLLNEFLV